MQRCCLGTPQGRPGEVITSRGAGDSRSLHQPPMLNPDCWERSGPNESVVKGRQVRFGPRECPEPHLCWLSGESDEHVPALLDSNSQRIFQRAGPTYPDNKFPPLPLVQVITKGHGGTYSTRHSLCTSDHAAAVDRSVEGFGQGVVCPMSIRNQLIHLDSDSAEASVEHPPAYHSGESPTS